MKRLKQVVAMMTLCFLHSVVLGQSSWPNGNVRFIIPWPAGGLNDLVARSINDEVSAHIGVPIVPDYRPGAGGTLGVGAISRARPDGSIIGMGNLGPLTIYPNLYEERLYDVDSDLIPIMSFAASPLVLAVPASSPITTAEELIAEMNAKPEHYNFASVGVGSPQHLTFELFQSHNNVRGTHIPYNGTAEYMVDFTSGTVHATFDTLPLLIPHIRAGKIRPLAVTTGERTALLPEVPTLIEMSLLRPEDTVSSWYGLIAPAGTPDNVIEKLYKEYNRAAQTEKIQKLLHENGLMYEQTSMEEYQRNVVAETTRWKEIIAKANIKVER